MDSILIVLGLKLIEPLLDSSISWDEATRLQPAFQCAEEPFDLRVELPHSHFAANMINPVHVLQRIRLRAWCQTLSPLILIHGIAERGVIPRASICERITGARYGGQEIRRSLPLSVGGQ